MRKTFNGATVPDNWSCAVPIGGPGLPEMEFTRIPGFGDYDGLVKGKVLHLSPKDFQIKRFSDGSPPVIEALKVIEP